MLYYAVIDTNVIVSAMMNPDSIPGNVLKHALGGRIDKEAYLVTGNMRHFPKKPFVVSPKEMMDIIESN